MPIKYIFFALGIGASIGAAVALLYAPQSGAATRKKIRHGAQDASDYIEDTAAYLKEQAERLSVEAQKFAEKARGSVDQVVDQAGDVVAGAVKTAQSLV